MQLSASELAGRYNILSLERKQNGRIPNHSYLQLCWKHCDGSM
jgi:hypothetical protein